MLSPSTETLKPAAMAPQRSVAPVDMSIKAYPAVAAGTSLAVHVVDQ